MKVGKDKPLPTGLLSLFKVKIMKIKDLNDKAKQALLLLEKEGLIRGNFPITDKLLSKYDDFYGRGDLKADERHSNRRITLLNLLEYKRTVNNIPTKDINEGFVYIISNIVWPGYYKVGRSVSPKSRVGNMQTSDPFRAYKVEGYYYTSDCAHTEKELHNYLSDYRINGEWFCIDLSVLRSFIKKTVYKVPFV